MKRCPECRRDYYDDSLSFCLDDGAALLEGPTSHAAEEPATAILSTEAAEQPTRAMRSGESRSGAGGVSHVASTRNSVIAGVVGIIIVTTLGVGSYLYYGRSGARQIDSIAVLPFTNGSGNTEMEYLSDGLAESLISTLSQLSGLEVKARSSAFRYKGKDVDPKTIASELGVQALVNGKFAQVGDKLSLYVELVDGSTEKAIWSQTYERPAASLVALKQEVARDVSERLRTRLTGTDRQRLAVSETANPEAYQLYLQGRFFWNKRRITEMGKAIDYFQRAIATDPNFARAYAGLADAVAQPNDLVPSEQRAEKARAAANRALEIDPELAEAHTSLGHILARYDLDFAGAERELKRSLELDAKWADTYQRYGELYSFLGRNDEAIETLRQGLTIEPFNIPLNASLGGVLINARRYDEAIQQLNKTLELDPTHRNAHIALVTAYAQKGMYPEAVEHRVTALRIANQYEWADNIRQAFASGGWPAVLRVELDRFSMPQRSPDRLPLYNQAAVLGALGEKDRAFDALNRSIEARENPSLVFLNSDPRFDPLRGDPRFQEILKRLGFTGKDQ